MPPVSAVLPGLDCYNVEPPATPGACEPLILRGGPPCHDTPEGQHTAASWAPGGTAISAAASCSAGSVSSAVHSSAAGGVTAQLPAGDTPPPSIDRNRDEDGTQRRMAGPTGESQPGLPPPGTTSQRAFIWAPHCAGGKSQSPGLSGWNFRWSPSRP